ncbi:hypothetical protein DPEC_G00025940 [Dallia pectoralis]|uniref:Uncharacterized protein n=1 Tax=Dallia pectoralis TaxID=75939 RepID=A0ACC2HHM5_DALPE|nr:hypothetical protein DPEC_G00025940 [Dallia pectoralis]
MAPITHNVAVIWPCNELAVPNPPCPGLDSPVLKGSLGLVDVRWREPACTLRRRGGGLGLVLQLFHMRPVRLITQEVSGLLRCCAEGMAADRAPTSGRLPGPWARRKPISHNSLILLRSVLQGCLMAADIEPVPAEWWWWWWGVVMGVGPKNWHNIRAKRPQGCWRASR